MGVGWIIGYLIGGFLVVVVVVLLSVMIRGASAAADKTGSILAALEDSRDNTAVLWAVDDVNDAVERITDGARDIRRHLSAGTDPTPATGAGRSGGGS